MPQSEPPACSPVDAGILQPIARRGKGHASQLGSIDRDFCPFGCNAAGGLCDYG
jgi:hypothetical protein